MRLSIGVEFDGGLSRTDYCHGLVCWRKEATRGRRTGRFCRIGTFHGIVAGFCDDRLGARVVNLLQARKLALEGVLLRDVIAYLDWKMRNMQKE